MIDRKNPIELNSSILVKDDGYSMTIKPGIVEGYDELGGGIQLTGINISEEDKITFDVTSMGEHSVPILILLLNEEKEEVFRGVFGVLPGTKTTCCFEAAWLDGQYLFPPRTPGVLKIVLHGKPTDVTEISSMIIGARSCHEETEILIDRFEIGTDNLKCTIDSNEMVDEMGQWHQSQWSGKYKSLDEMVSNGKKYFDDLKKSTMIRSDEFSRWGGIKALKLCEGTGYFSVQEASGRYWLADPDGYAFISHGVDCVNQQSAMQVKGVEHLISPEVVSVAKSNGVYTSNHRGEFINFPELNMKRILGDGYQDDYELITKKQVQSFGFNTLGNWSDLAFCRRAQMPYVLPLDTAVSYPNTNNMIFRDFPDVFSKEFEEQSLLYAKGLKSYCEDPYLIGYFMQNEPSWAFVHNLIIAEEMLASEGMFDSKKVFLEVLKDKYIDVTQLNLSWSTQFGDFSELEAGFRVKKMNEVMEMDMRAFSRIMIKRYVDIPAKACRVSAPNHLNLGMRYAYVHDFDQLSGYENYDVFSINCYKWSPYKDIEKIADLTGKPVMIGEFHFGAMDSLTTSTGIKGVLTQEDRGRAYYNYYVGGMRSKYFVGAHYFQWLDQASLGRFDGENYNIGCLTQTLKPYDEMKTYVQKTEQMLAAFQETKGYDFVETELSLQKVPEIFF